MLRLLKTKVNLGFIVNPFYLYSIAFSVSISIYLFGWSKIYPELSNSLIVFFVCTFAISIFAGSILIRKRMEFFNFQTFKPFSFDIIFWLLIVLCLINLFYMGYLPILDQSHNYREFGMPLIDPLFNSLCIFFSVSFFRSFLYTRKKKYIFYFLIILFLQTILFRRSTIIWILSSSAFLFLLYKQKISLIVIAISLLLIPALSYCFGLYGNKRSNLSESFVINELGASDNFIKMGISHNHYMTYLYLSSPLANLQQNVIKTFTENKKKDFKEFIFYSIIPESFTKRLEKPLQLSPPSCYLISPELIAGSFYMVSFYTMGWYGMIMQFMVLSIFILLCLIVIKKYNSFRLETFSLLATTISLLIFSNFLNRLDVLFMLFVYPVIFHLIFTRNTNNIFRIKGNTLNSQH